MKKLINDPAKVVREMLEGFADVHPGVALADTENVIIQADIPAAGQRAVAVISGGGAGHEPAHAGYVGAGMLHAAVVGDVFTSPSVDAVLAAIRAMAGPQGAVLIVKNYTGDRLNFGLAAELARTSGIPVEIVIVADDVALRETVPPERRRGIAGTVLVHKIVGALAASGASLERAAAAGRAAAAAVGTMAVALDACTIPAVGKPGFSLGPGEIELGLGIHGEQGVERGRLRPADELVDRILEVILVDRGLVGGDRAVLLVNNLGGTTLMELGVVARRAIATLRDRGIVLERVWTGTLLSALEMPGCSLSVMKVDDAMVSWLDAPTTAPAWPGDGRVPPRRKMAAFAPEAGIAAEVHRSADTAGPMVRHLALACAAAIQAEEPRLTELDSIAGDGDLGVGMARGAEAVREFCAVDAGLDAASVLAGVAGVLRRAIAGSSGPLYAVALVRGARALAASPVSDAHACAMAFEQAVLGVTELGGAMPGDRTMVDALRPAADALKTAIEHGVPLGPAWILAADAADQGAAATATMQPRLGRASYLGGRVIGTPDGGAIAVAVLLRAIARTLAPHGGSQT